MKTITLVQAGALVVLMILGAYAANGQTPRQDRPHACAADACIRPVGEV